MNPLIFPKVTIAPNVALGLGGAKLASKITGKPVGVPASPEHILTNDKLDKKAKVNVVKEQLQESAKDTLKVGGIVLGSATAASLVAGNSKKVSGFLQTQKGKVGNLLSKVTVNSKNLKEIIQGNNLYKKLNALPAPSKAAIAAAAATLSIVTPIATIVSARKAGYIEGKQESNTLMRRMHN